MKKLPTGVSNFEKLITNDYYYVDKTKYIEKIENYSNSNVFFLRPRKFGKSLFTDTLKFYYDINESSKFDILFKDTYIGKNPTKERNSYYVLMFDFSGIDTNSTDSTISGFRKEVNRKVDYFVKRYNLDFYVNDNMESEDIISDLFLAFSIQKPNEKIYVIIDEYDHFANELLSFDFSSFTELVTQNGKVRKFYEKLKEGTKSVVGRIFMTGVAPITIDSMTSGFNIADDLSRDLSFNTMMGFNEKELRKIMENQGLSIDEQNKIIPTMKENYDGYSFNREATEKLYNSNMSLYFLNEYTRYKKIPDKLLDSNVASDYEKIGNMLKLCNGEKKFSLLLDVISGKGVVSNIVDKFNPKLKFGDEEMLSMLYYLGFLTIDGSDFNVPILRIPNAVIKQVYAKYFIHVIEEETSFYIQPNYIEMIREVAYEGKIEKIIDILKQYITNLSNRDFIKFDEKYLKVLFYSISMNLNSAYWVKSEPEYNRNYPDILIVPKEPEKDYKSVMVEFKYLKKSEESKLEEKQKEAKEQIERYSEYDEIKNIKNLRKYTVVAVVDDVYVEEI